RRLEQRLGREGSRGERVGDLRERQEIRSHSMILGTTNASPFCCGACASTVSRGRLGRTTSSRSGAAALVSPANPSGSTPSTSTAWRRSMYSRTWPSWAAKRSSSSLDKASRARRATCLTWARSIATAGSPLRLVGRLEPVEHRPHHRVWFGVRVHVVPGVLFEEGAAAGRAVQHAHVARLLGDHQRAAVGAAAAVELPQVVLVALAEASLFLVVQLAQALRVLAGEILVLNSARLVGGRHSHVLPD